MNGNKIFVRKATRRDIALIVEFQLAMSEETEGKTLDAALLRHGVKVPFRSPEKGFYLVATSNQVVVESLLITYEWSDWRNATFW